MDDLISRHDVIKALKGYVDRFVDDEDIDYEEFLCISKTIDWCTRVVQHLPSNYPDIVIDAIKTNQWTPCRLKFPAEEGRYVVMVHKRPWKYVTIVSWRGIPEQWKYVTAWMELPYEYSKE